MQASQYWNLLFCKEHLEEYYSEKMKYKPSMGLDKISPKKFEEKLHENIDIIVRKTKNGTYKFTRYKQLLFTKGPSKPPRAVCVPTLRDKLTTSVLNELLVGVYGIECQTQMPHIIIDKIIRELPNFAMFIKLDVKSFYASVNHEKLLRILKKKIRKKEILELIKKSIKTPAIMYPIRAKEVNVEREKGLPEGLPISNSLANIFMLNLDLKYKKHDNILYHRYVDDILILTQKTNFEFVKKEIEKDISKLDLSLNDKADEGEITDGFEYLGYKFNSHGVTVRQSSVLKIEQSIEDLFKEIKGSNLSYIEWKINLKITGFVLDRHKYGWLFFYSQITDISLLYHLDDVVKKLAKRYKVAERVKIKRFVRTYAEMRQALHETKYIPNLDNLTVEEKRRIVSEIYGVNLKEKSDETIEWHFRRIMQREIRDIEKDIQNIS